MVLGAKKRVIVHTTPNAGSQTIEGILLRKKPEFVLDLASLVTGVDQGEETKLQIQGRVHLLRENVAFYQDISL